MAITFIDFIQEVLKISDIPLTPQEIWDKGVELKLDEKLKSSGATPWSTIGAKLFVDTRDNENSPFVKVGKRPARFYLKSKIEFLPSDIIQKIEEKEQKESSKKANFHERELHPLLAYFANANPLFNRGRNIYTKTIFHEKSTKKGLNEWLHPDMVGFYLPIDDWKPDLLDFNKITDNNSLRLFSFELKIKLDKSNYRESFFQAVSNSSWAHEGYLVASYIANDDDLMSELERLSMSFGIGIIKLNLEDIDSSSVLFHAKKRESLDWETMNKLSERNPDFMKFLQDIKIDFESKRIHKSEYDNIIDPYKYIEEKLLANK
jgi:hypothetical protein